MYNASVLQFNIMHYNDNFYICSGGLRLLKKSFHHFCHDTSRMQSLALSVTKKLIAKAIHINERLFIKCVL